MVSIIAAVIFAAFCVYIYVLSIRLELFRPSDEPTIFDRKHRKVYRHYREVDLGWPEIFMAWPRRLAIYDWDAIHAEHHAVINANTATVSRQHVLAFVVEHENGIQDPSETFTIGTILMTELSVPAVWEHIRAFMEDGGPHVPPGEAPIKANPPASFRHSLTGLGPYGRDFPIWWRQHRVMTIFAIILAPLGIPFAVSVGACAWLSHITAVQVDWPKEILDAVGAPIASGAELGDDPRGN